jgi:hypothetical protein
MRPREAETSVVTIKSVFRLNLRRANGMTPITPASIARNQNGMTSAVPFRYITPEFHVVVNPCRPGTAALSSGMK